jgi:hypothetical protein
MNNKKEIARITNLHYTFANQYNEDPKAFEALMTKDIPDWKFVQGNRGVLVVDKGDKRVISVKGTDPTHPGDILSDVALAAGLHKSNKQFIDRKNQIKSILRESKGKDVYLTGHSLGASIASYALASSPSIARNIKEAHLFNPGSTPMFEATLKPRPENVTLLEDKIHTYKHEKDIISKTAGKYGSVYITRKEKKGVSPHSILNWVTH